MTRVNLIPVEELADQHLIREYQELPQPLKRKVNIEGDYCFYRLNKGHVKWIKTNWKFCFERHKELCKEMKFRGFKVNHPTSELEPYIKTLKPLSYVYKPSSEEINISRQRIIEKISLKPDWYRWTKREKPFYINKIKEQR